MSNQVSILRVKGLQPLLDVKQVKEPYVLTGSNFIIDAQGPVSGLGRDILAYKAIANPKNVQTFIISEISESLFLTNEGIFRLDTEMRRLVPLYVLPVLIDTQYPWSMAAVGNRYYFARQNSDLIEYDIYSNKWTILDIATYPTIPENIYACTESDGRLIVVTPIWAAWSAIGEGRDFVASTITGAGAQALTKLGVSNTTPLGVVKTEEGFLTFTTSGILRSIAIDAQNPFRHRVLSQHHVPLNPYCITKTIDESVIFLSEAGLFETDGSKTNPWQPVMSEYLHSQIIPRLDLLNNKNAITLNFDYDNAWFVIAIAEEQQDYFYTKGFILNIAVDEWGVINTPFVSLVKIQILPKTYIDFAYGFIDFEGSIYIINQAPGIEYIPDLDYGIIHHSIQEELEAVDLDDILNFRVEADFKTISKSGMLVTGVYNRYATLYTFVSPINHEAIEKDTTDTGGILSFKTSITAAASLVDLGIQLVPKQYNPLNSFVEIGGLRLTDEAVYDRLSYITNISVSMNEEAVGSTTDDWASLILYPVDIIVDWNVLDGEEDWGESVFDSVQYTLNLKPTLDGYNIISDVKVLLEKIKTVGKTSFYSCYSMGLYHNISIEAFNVGDNYHLKTMDLTMNLGGRL